jgi:hypothetical protein
MVNAAGAAIASLVAVPMNARRLEVLVIPRSYAFLFCGQVP